MNKGMLYICATPIGNLEDITLRALRIMRECDVIACEDTRHTVKLLNHFEIKKPMISYHQHNENQRCSEIADRVRSGEQVVLVTDAGMPCISDPGYILVDYMQKLHLPVCVLPGASATVSALALSGINSDRFCFEGFLPTVKKQLKQRLEQLQNEERTIIIYESPHRLKQTLKDMAAVMPTRQIAIVKEITKMYEACNRYTLAEAAEAYKDAEVLGEHVLVLEGAVLNADVWDIQPEDRLRAFISGGMDIKDAIKQVAKMYGLPKNDIYMMAEELKGK